MLRRQRMRNTLYERILDGERRGGSRRKGSVLHCKIEMIDQREKDSRKRNKVLDCGATSLRW